MKQSLMSGAATTPFAHLLSAVGLSGRPARGARAEDEDDTVDKDDKDAKRGRRAEDEDDKDDKNDKDGRRAEDPDDPPKDDPVAEDDKDDKDAKRRAKAKADDDDDEVCAEEEDDDDDVSAAARAGRKAERARCRKIFSSSAAGHRPDVAAQLAFTTNLTSAEAIGVLEAAAAGSAAAVKGLSRVHERMARVPQPAVGQDAPEAARPKAAPAAMADAIVAARNKAQGIKA